MDPESGGHPSGDRDCAFTRIIFFSEAIPKGKKLSMGKGPLWKPQRALFSHLGVYQFVTKAYKGKRQMHPNSYPTPFWDHQDFDPREASLHLHSLPPPLGSTCLREGQSLLLNRKAMAGLYRS